MFNTGIVVAIRRKLGQQKPQPPTAAERAAQAEAEIAAQAETERLGGLARALSALPASLAPTAACELMLGAARLQDSNSQKMKMADAARRVTS